MTLPLLSLVPTGDPKAYYRRIAEVINQIITDPTSTVLLTSNNIWKGTNIFGAGANAIGGTFPGVGVSTAQIIAGTDYAALSLIDAQQGADGRFWNVATSGGAFGILLVNDADTVGKIAIQCTRSGMTLNSITLGNTTDKAPVTINGATIIATPASGAALTVNSLAGLGISVVTPNGAATQINLAQTGQHTVSLYQAAADNAFRIFINGLDRLVLGDSGSLQSYGPVAASLLDLTPDKGTGAVQCTSGMTTTPSVTGKFWRIGQMAFLEIPPIVGTGSGGNTLTFSVAFPTGFAPTIAKGSTLSTANAGVGITSLALLSSTGFTLVTSPAGTNYTGTCGFNVSVLIPYPID